MPEHFIGSADNRDFKFPSEEREYQELFRENFEEHEKWQKNLKEVVNAMKRKRDALQEVVQDMKRKRGYREEARMLFIVLGGAMQGPYGVGQMDALLEMAYMTRNVSAKDAFLGMSVGATTCAFGLAGKKQALLGTSYFYRICTKKEFLNFLRIHKVVDVSVIEKAMRNPATQLDVDAVRKQPAQFFVQAFNENKKEPEFIDAKDPNIDMIDALHASMAIPFIYDEVVAINGRKFTDGAFNDPLPIVRAIEKFKPTHLLILPNMPFNQLPPGQPGTAEKWFMKLSPDKGFLGFVRKILANRQAVRQSLELIQKQKNVKIGVFWPSDMGLDLLTQDGIKIKSAIKQAAKETFALFGEPERFLKLYEQEYPEDQWSKQIDA